MDTFNHKDYEKLWYDRWVEKGSFKAEVSSKKEPYTIMMPPPNVTGSLHMGHGLTFTLQDLLIRFFRKKGRRPRPFFYGCYCRNSGKSLC